MNKDEREIKIPETDEQIDEATLIAWHKAPGDSVAADEVIAEIMTDKVNLEIPAPCAGVIIALMAEEGDTVSAGQTIASMRLKK